MKLKGKISVMASALLVTVLFLGQTYVSSAFSSIIPIIDTFSADKTNVDVGEEVTFTVLLSVLGGPAEYYIYQFHDGSGNVSTSGTMTHSFLYEGIYLVTVEAIGPGNISDLKTLEIHVTNEKPIIGDLIFPLVIQEDEIITFDVTSVLDSEVDMNNLNYTWYLGDNQIYNNKSFTTSISQAGLYAVSLYVFDDQAALDLKTEFITVENVQPTANFTISPLTSNDIYQENQILTLNALTSLDSPSDINNLRYYWNFDDGIVERGSVVTHEFTSSGQYNISLIVMDDDGAKNETFKIISIENLPPSIDIIEDSISINEGDSFTYISESNDNLTDYNQLEYDWSFGGTGKESTFLHLEDGAYIQNVTVTDPEGETASDSINVDVVNVPPEVSINSFSIKGNLSIWVLGLPGSMVTLNIFRDDVFYSNTTVFSDPIPPLLQNITIPIDLDLPHDWRFELNASYENVTLFGINTMFLSFSFDDVPACARYFLTHTFYKLCYYEHTFWSFDLADHVWGMPVRIGGSIFDPSTDELEGTIYYNCISIKDIYRSPGTSWEGELPFDITLYPLCSYNNISVYVKDENNATSYTSMIIERECFFDLSFGDIAPHVDLSIPSEVIEEQPSLYSAYVRDIEPDNLTYFWYFGDGTNSTEENPIHVFNHSGDYLVRLSVSDGTHVTTKGKIVSVRNSIPDVSLQGNFEGYEDEKLLFQALLQDTPSDKESLLILWDFGDGSCGTGTQIQHSYARSGNYDLKIIVNDDNGAKTELTQSILITDKPPLVEGPFGFDNIEGNSFTPRVSIRDSILDEPGLAYKWSITNVSQTFNLQSKIPTIITNNGEYNLQLNVTDNFKNVSTMANIKLNALIMAPTVLISPQHIFYGSESNYTLKAYVFDSYIDENSLNYSWTVDYQEIIPTLTDGFYSELELLMTTSGLKQGYVQVFEEKGKVSNGNSSLNGYHSENGYDYQLFSQPLEFEFTWNYSTTGFSTHDGELFKGIPVKVNQSEFESTDFETLWGVFLNKSSSALDWSDHYMDNHNETNLAQVNSTLQTWNGTFSPMYQIPLFIPNDYNVINTTIYEIVNDTYSHYVFNYSEIIASTSPLNESVLNDQKIEIKLDYSLGIIQSISEYIFENDNWTLVSSLELVDIKAPVEEEKVFLQKIDSEFIWEYTTSINLPYHGDSLRALITRINESSVDSSPMNTMWGAFYNNSIENGTWNDVLMQGNAEIPLCYVNHSLGLFDGIALSYEDIPLFIPNDFDLINDTLQDFFDAPNIKFDTSFGSTWKFSFWQGNETHYLENTTSYTISYDPSLGALQSLRLENFTASGLELLGELNLKSVTTETEENVGPNQNIKSFNVMVIIDTDGDGLSDEEEELIGSLATEADSDGDYLSDAWEVIIGTNPMNNDTDGDGLVDGFSNLTFQGEAGLGTDPNSWDTDKDGLNDSIEIYGWYIEVDDVPRHIQSNPLSKDTDRDNLTDYEEFINGFDPQSNDTDGDGVYDRQEWEENLLLSTDSDGDGVPDGVEMSTYSIYIDGVYSHDTTSDPLKADSDGDGLTDMEERFPGEDGIVTDAMDPDTDNDHLPDGSEFYSISFEFSEKLYSNGEKVGRPKTKNGDSLFLHVDYGDYYKNITLTIGLSGDDITTNNTPIHVLVKYGDLILVDDDGEGPYFYRMYEITENLTMKKQPDAPKVNLQGNLILEISSLQDKNWILEDFSIEGTKILNPLNPDFDGDGLCDGYELVTDAGHGWITDPTVADTDSDGVNDYTEEVIKKSNPLTKDTDADGVWDGNDVDPLYNLLIKVTVIKVHFGGD
ncbi:MAG: PKD domain-containing protein, partial [Candidatus Helarchaeota archaeon]